MLWCERLLRPMCDVTILLVDCRVQSRILGSPRVHVHSLRKLRRALLKLQLGEEQGLRVQVGGVLLLDVEGVWGRLGGIVKNGFADTG